MTSSAVFTVDEAKTKAAPKYATLDKKDAKKFYVISKIDSFYTDGAVYKFTKTDTLMLPSEFMPANSAGSADTLIGFVATPKEGGMPDTSFVKLATTIKRPEKTDTVYTSVAKKSSTPNVVIEKTVGSSSYWMMVLLVFVQILYVTMVYGPIAAFLVELFPTRIRYTSMSLPYHIGNGVFGGLVPFLSTLIITYTHSPLSGLWYPIIVAAISLVIGLLYLSSSDNKHVSHEGNELN